VVPATRANAMREGIDATGSILTREPGFGDIPIAFRVHASTCREGRYPVSQAMRPGKSAALAEPCSDVAAAPAG